MDGWSNGGSSADLFRRAREKILILLLRVVVLLSEKEKRPGGSPGARTDGQMDVSHMQREGRGADGA